VAVFVCPASIELSVVGEQASRNLKTIKFANPRANLSAVWLENGA